MANQLKMAEQHAITRLAEHGWSYRRIAREMGVHRETVARYVALAQGALASGPAPPQRAADSLISITGCEKIARVERGTEWLLKKVSRIGPHASRWAESMLAERGIPGVRVLVGLMSLAHRHRDDQIEAACEVAQTHGAYRLRSIRELIKRSAPLQEQFDFIESHPIIRGMDEYGALVRHALRRESASRAIPEEEPAPQVPPQTPPPWTSFPSAQGKASSCPSPSVYAGEPT